MRLVHGDFARETIYGDDPVEMALRWEAEGATRLHVVDLDGARDGVRGNAATIERLLSAVRIPVQVGGGIRTLQLAKDVLDAGAARIVVGTAAAESLTEMRQWAAELTPERLVVGVDARDGFVATRGWAQATELDVASFCHALSLVGVRRILFTDISRDGTLNGPNVQAIREIVQRGELRVIASGGVGSVDDLQQIAAAGAESAVVGKALYDGRITLGAALSTVTTRES